MTALAFAGRHSEFAGFARRILRAMGRRLATSSPEDLTDLLALRAEVDAAIDVAVAGMRRAGFSWTDIGDALGITRQAARQRWADNVGLSADRAS